MPYKIVEVGGKKYIEAEDDKAVFVHADGTEAPLDAEGTLARITALNAESTGRRHEINELKKTVARFEGIEDPEKAKEAIATVANLSSGELKTAAQVEEIKRAAQKAAETQVADAQRKAAEDLKKASDKAEKLEAELFNEKIGGGFARSKFVAEKMTIPPDIAQNFFGKNFKIVEGAIEAYDSAGMKLYSKTRGGELANFDEAIEQLVSAYPNKDAILKGAGGGSGGTGNDDKNRPSKDALKGLDPVARMNVARGVAPGQRAGAR